MKSLTSIPLALLLTALAPAALRANVKLPAVFGDHMVLQRDAQDTVWGTAGAGESITVKFAGQSVATKAGADGKWSVKLAPLKATATAADLTVAGSNTVTIHDVLVGDVWDCSGQSNMALPLSGASNAATEIPQANHPDIRILFVKTKPALTPQSDGEAEWKVCTPDSAKNMSAVGYFFGKEIAESEKVPVGLINASVGATPAQAWTSLETLQSDPDLKQGFADSFVDFTSHLDDAKAKHDEWLAKGGAAYLAAVRKYNGDAYMAQKNGQSPPPRPTPYPIPEPIHPDSNALPTVLFNGMIAPLMPFAIKGVIWYQGESNGGGVPLYRKLFPAMITDWRKHWGIGDFPFLYVQLPNYGPRSPDPDNSDGGWPGIRETQMLALKTVPNTGMAVTIEAGDGKNLHPPYKDIVGHRLALVARRLVYGEEIDSSGPMYDSFKVEGDKIRITFKNVDKGLKIGVPPHVTAGETPPPKDELKGFAISGTDNKFVWAKAEIAGPDAIVVSAESVKNPANVRYGWAADPVVNLYNSADLPASPFRTDPPAAK